MRSRFFLRICFHFCLLFILWGHGSSKVFASSSACYLFYEVKVLPKDLLPVLPVIYSMWSGSSKGFASTSACYLFYEVKVLPKDLLPVLLWGQGSLKGFASSSTCYLFYEVKVLPKDLLPVLLAIFSMRSRFSQRICFQFCLWYIIWFQGSSTGFASSSACYLFYEVTVLSKDLLPVCLLFILWGQGSSKGFASSSACYLFYDVKDLQRAL